MNTKKIPALVMLAAGSIAVVVTYINHYSLEDMLVVLILTLIVFLIIGVAVKLVFDSFHIEEPDEDRVDDEGEVVDKTESQDEEKEGTEGSPEEGREETGDTDL